MRIIKEIYYYILSNYIFTVIYININSFVSKADVLCDILSEDFAKEGSSHDLFPYVQRFVL